MRNRLVPEDRIKTLYVVKSYALGAMDDEDQMHYMIQDAGLELAKKLFEHKKYLLEKDGKFQRLTLSIDIIVPEKPPKCLA